jgi:uncharacterized protein (DUF433 family)
MTREELLSRVAINPEIRFAKPCIRGLGQSAALQSSGMC